MANVIYGILITTLRADDDEICGTRWYWTDDGQSDRLFEKLEEARECMKNMPMFVHPSGARYTVVAQEYR